ncbi:hypothetical protein LTR84_009565 [Exophiala bonariae]|uniref:Amino acid permease/ SLC12A domain-containing protein n=1 Tax=Exophiala bonariae TaxID=1690606 RepID=A0AAV9NK77_9EURO|nr:hypothetical protein LTR84_009565 [Exophiala bonariae]
MQESSEESMDLKMKNEITTDLEAVGPFTSNIEASATPLERTSTKRGLKSRHAQMIALGGTIGTGLFVGSGQGLRMGGPVFLVVAYSLITVMVFGIVTATTEMSSYLPVPGSSVAYYGKRYFSSSMGFALGWMYWYIFSITVPAEITAGTLVIQYWSPPVHNAVWITILMVVIVALNALPVRFYGETEFWFASIKVFGIIGLLIMALVLVLGGGPNHQRLGFHYWNNPAPINDYLVTGSSGKLCAFLGTTIFSMYAFAFAPELLVVTGGEMESPRRNLPVAGKRYFYRLVVFYVLGVLAISMIVPSDDPKLLGGGSGAGSSPWAVAVKNAGIAGLDSVINAIILTSAWSAGNSYLYMASRALYSMAVAGSAPRIFMTCTGSGIPYYAVAASASFSLLSYLNLSSTGATVFNWFVNLINTGGFTSWVAVCVIYLRFRKATLVQNVTDLPYRSKFQPYMAYISGTFFFMLLLLNGFKVFVHGYWNASSFLTSYIGIPIFLLFFFAHKFLRARNEPWMIPSDEVDLYSGLDEIIANEMPLQRREKWYQKWRAVFE